MIIDKILAYLNNNEKIVDVLLQNEVEKIAGYSFRRQFMEDKERSGGQLYVSSAGKCPRQQAYAYHNIPKKGKEIDARAKIIFFQGDLVELLIIGLAKTAGCVITGTGLGQMSVNIPVNGAVISGHPDGILFADEPYLVEVKSMSDYSFDTFERGEIDEAYVAQVNLYMDALNLDKCVFIGLNKNNGVLHEVIINKDLELVKKLKADLQLILTSTPDKLPAPKYIINEKGFYPWQCLYCAYWGHCRPTAEKVVVGKSYKLKELKKQASTPAIIAEKEKLTSVFETETQKNVGEADLKFAELLDKAKQLVAETNTRVITDINKMSEKTLLALIKMCEDVKAQKKK